MQESLLRTLRANRAIIRSRWEALLRIEKVNTPLANPDALVYLFDQTLDEVFKELRKHRVPKHVEDGPCHCGQNPLVKYFVAGEQALLESLVLAQVELPALNPVQRDADFAQLKEVIHTIACREISALDQVCQHPPVDAGAGI